nr:hypothetical protein [Allomuricauda taeanensis]
MLILALTNFFVPKRGMAIDKPSFFGLGSVYATSHLDASVYVVILGQEKLQTGPEKATGGLIVESNTFRDRNDLYGVYFL